MNYQTHRCFAVIGLCILFSLSTLACSPSKDSDGNAAPDSNPADNDGENTSTYPPIVFEGYTNSYGASWELIADQQKQATVKELLIPEMEKYPFAYYETTKLKAIMVVQNMNKEGKPWGGIADGDKNVLFLNAYETLFTEDWGRWGFLAGFHHEQHHLTEWTILKSYTWPVYEELYHGLHFGGSYAYQDGVSGWGSGYNPEFPEFLNNYSRLAPEEDRAEIVSWFMYEDSGLREYVLQRAQENEVFYQKGILVFTLLSEQVGFPAILQEFIDEVANH
jgi:hypothetical protein